MQTRKPDTDRYRAWVARKKLGRISVAVEIQRGAFVDALAKRGLVQAGMPVSREAIAAHAGAVLQLWADEQRER